MQDVKKDVDTLALTNELNMRRYQFNKERIKRALSLPDYIALHIIRETENQETIYGGKTYLKDLAERMQLTIRQTSKLAGKLKDRGLILWSHDGNGSEGTYVTITESGRKLLEKEEITLKKYYGNVIQEFGRDNMIHLLQMMKQLETIMSSEYERMEMAEDESGTDEQLCESAGDDLQEK